MRKTLRDIVIGITITSNLLFYSLVALSLYDYTKRELVERKYKDKSYQEVIDIIKTPREAQDYCSYYLRYQYDKELYGSEDYWATFNLTHKNRAGDCDDGALAAAALLQDNGYEPLILSMSSYSEGHAVYLYKKDGKYGSIGINSTDYHEPKFDSLDSLVNTFRPTLFKKYEYYYVINVNDCLKQGDNIIDSSKDLSYIDSLVGKNLYFIK